MGAFYRVVFCSLLPSIYLMLLGLFFLFYSNGVVKTIKVLTTISLGNLVTLGSLIVLFTIVPSIILSVFVEVVNLNEKQPIYIYVFILGSLVGFFYALLISFVSLDSSIGIISSVISLGVGALTAVTHTILYRVNW